MVKLLSNKARDYIKKLEATFDDKNDVYYINNENIQVVKITKRNVNDDFKRNISLKKDNKTIYSLVEEKKQDGWCHTKTETFYVLDGKIEPDNDDKEIYFTKDIFKINENGVWKVDHRCSFDDHFMIVDKLFLDTENDYFKVYYDYENDEVGLMINGKKNAITIDEPVNNKKIQKQVIDIISKHNDKIKLVKKEVINEVVNILNKEGLTNLKKELDQGNKNTYDVIEEYIKDFFSDNLELNYHENELENFINNLTIIKSIYKDYINYIDNQNLINDEIKNLNYILEYCADYDKEAEQLKQEYDNELNQETDKIKEKLKKKYGINN